MEKQKRNRQIIVITCSWCGCDIEDPDDAFIVGTEPSGEDRYWCGECEEGMEDDECCI
jgi:hypothetical protein